MDPTRVGHAPHTCECACINHCSPSLDKASRMLRQAVARSEMDCHSSSVESVVSERTTREKRQHLFNVKGTYPHSDIAKRVNTTVV